MLVELDDEGPDTAKGDGLCALEEVDGRRFRDPLVLHHDDVPILSGRALRVEDGAQYLSLSRHRSVCGKEKGKGLGCCLGLLDQQMKNFGPCFDLTTLISQLCRMIDCLID